MAEHTKEDEKASSFLTLWSNNGLYKNQKNKNKIKI